MLKYKKAFMGTVLHNSIMEVRDTKHRNFFKTLKLERLKINKLSQEGKAGIRDA